jgi:[CysO sulfur-carrier protein]-S-L-cysteine hydrolase
MENEILLITHDHLKKLRILAMNSLPNESCAILLGNKSANKNIVKDIVPLKNAARSNIEFNIDSDELFFAYDKAKSMNLNVISIFHSHPSIPFPSETDKIYMHLNPVIWIIYSTINNSVKSFVLDGVNNVREIKIELIKG